MTRLQGCPDCARPYDVEGLEALTPLRCLCGTLFRVGAGPRTERARVCGHCGAPAGADARECMHCSAGLEAALCPSCFSRSPRGARHCSACGLALTCRGLRPLPEEAACPRCRGELGLRILDGADALVECTACGGLWIEPDEFDRLCRRADDRSESVLESASGGPGPVPYVPCVGCGELMVRRQFAWRGRRAPVVLDFCRDHGVWLDGDELARVVSFVRRSADGEEPTPGLPPEVFATTSPRSAGPVGFFGGLLELFLGTLDVLE